MLEGLKPEQFDYSEFVAKYDKAKECGTVCCVAGWYPKYIQEAGLYWDPKSSNGLVSKKTIRLSTALSEYHGLGEEVIDCLFYGYSFISESDMYGAIYSADSDLDDVTILFKKVYEGIDSGDIEHL